MPLVLPISIANPDYTYRCQIEGVTYGLRFRWLSRPRAWYLTLSDSAGRIIRSGIKLLPEWPLMHRLRHPARPPGEMIVIGPLTSPSLEGLGVDHKLYYLTLAEQAALRPAAAITEAVTIEVTP